MMPYPLTNAEIQKYYQNESKFNTVYWRINLPEIQNGAYVINFHKNKSIGTHWIALHINGDNLTYFDSFGAEHNPWEIKKYISNKIIETIFHRILENDSLMCRYFFSGFIDFLLKSKSLLDYTNFVFPSEYEINDKIIPKYFQELKTKIFFS